MKLTGRTGTAALLTIALAAAVAALAPLAAAQRRPATVRRVVAPAAYRRAGRARRQQKQQPAIHFGDVDLSGFTDLELDSANGVAKVSGPGTTVDSVDPKDPKSKTRLQSSAFTAYLDPKDSKRVERVVSGAGFRFHGTRPSQGSGVQTLDGTGSRGVYYKSEGRMVLEGPVDFHGEQPSSDGKSVEKVDGKAGQATYDENKQVLTLEGGVSATWVSPPRFPDPMPFASETLQVDMSKRPYFVKLHNTNPSQGSVKIKPPAEQPGGKKP